MRDPTLLAAVVFVLVAIAVQQLLAGLSVASRSRRDRARRFAALEPAADPMGPDALRRLPPARSSFSGGIRRLVQQSGTRLSLPALGATGAGVTLVVWLVLPVPATPLLRLPLAAFAAAGCVGGWLHHRRSRRMRLFAEQLPEVLDIVVRSLRAGHPLAVSLGLAAREVPEPAGGEFALVMGEVSYGRSLGEALDNLASRVDNPELRFFVAATAIAQQTGGNLGEILSRLSRTLRDRFKLARRVRALSAEGRFSGVALSILPVALFGLIELVSPSYYAEFWSTPAAATIAAVAVGLLAIGNLLIARLVNVKV